MSGTLLSSTTLANLNKKLSENVLNHRGHIFHFGFTRNFCMGAGMAYAIEREKYWHLPFILLYASPYCGYQAYKNRDGIFDKFKSILD